ncbi:MAG TPA: sigma factor-like helix-turn-helix DNA-binding protein [Verrucomicrobiae bacterium]|nr:sigma factor-like helix-turn-helix DNA-binding protein [Verrucomicrobiae bacterium]
MLIKPKKIPVECLRKLVETPFEESSPFNWRTVTAVRGALSRLSEKEKEIVERFHFCGESTAQIGARLNLSEFCVYATLRQARRKLKRILRTYVQKRYGVSIETANCPVCRSENREAIDRLMKTKTKEETWKRILRKLRNEYRLYINPRSLGRHWKEHTPRAGRKPRGSTV